MLSYSAVLENGHFSQYIHFTFQTIILIIARYQCPKCIRESNRYGNGKEIMTYTLKNISERPTFYSTPSWHTETNILDARLLFIGRL